MDSRMALQLDEPAPDDFSLLSWDDEVRLARAVEAGVLARAQRESGTGGPAAGVDELRALERLGEAAQRRMVAANVKLVSLVVGQHTLFPELVRADLFQDGCVGLIDAVQRFDHARGYRFATYALIRIRSSVRESAFRTQAGGGLTAARLREQRRLRWAESDLSQRLGRTARVAEVAALLGRDADWVAQLIDHEAALSIDDVADELVVDERVARSGHRPDAVQLAGLGSTLLERLRPTHRRVLELRFGFGVDARPHSLREISGLLGVTLGTARRLEKDALDHVRARCPYDARALL